MNNSEQLKIEAPRIDILPAVLVDKIAAGEVIEGPFSIIKELVENSLDAGASQVRIATEQAGQGAIIVEDDGIGIHPDDLERAVTRHATSKIYQFDDLERIYSFGFRGEALAAIAAVSVTEVRSRQEEQKAGRQIECRGGKIIGTAAVSCNRGTVVTVRDLFYATPARRKYLKSERAENIRNWRQLSRLALGHPRLQLVYRRDGREFIHLAAVTELKERIVQLFGKEIGNHLIEVNAELPDLRLWGYITDPHYYKSGRDLQFQYVNCRFVEIKNFSYFVRKAYNELLDIGRHPCYFLFLEIDPKRVDVNVHPQKREIRIAGDISFHDLLSRQLSTLLRPRRPISISSFRSDSVGSSAALKRLSHGLTPTEEILIHAPLGKRELHTISPHFAAGEGRLREGIAGQEQSDREQQQETQREIEREMQNGKEKGEKSEGKRSLFRFEHHFGVIFGTYILAIGEGDFYIIDQHTAHERINYEKMLRSISSQSNKRQPLLQPLVVEALPYELDTISAKSEELLKSGFLAECLGEKSYVIREVPPYVEPGSEKRIMQLLVRRVIEGEKDISLYQEYVAMKACKASVKKNDYLPAEVIADILQELPACEEPSRCPHGRPTMIRISPQELANIFQRGSSD